MTTSSTLPANPGLSADAYADKLFHATLGAVETLAAYVGDRMGWYSSLATDGPASASELAARTGSQPRYCLEWLEMQAAYGTLSAEPSARDPYDRRFTLPPGHAEVLTDEHSLAFLGALPRMFCAVGPHLPKLLDAYRSGGGVSWAELGDDAREAQAALNRPWFESQLGPALAGCPEVHHALVAPGTRIVDVGCGAGWSTIALARAYPGARLVGVDVDQPSLDLAVANATRAGVGERISFRLAGGEALAEGEQFDAAFSFEAVHDMPRPVEVLAAIRRSVRPGGPVIIMDEAVAEEFAAPADEVDRLMYGFSMFVCLPDGLSSTPSEGTGTVFRPSVLRSYAERAGFTSVSVLPIRDFSFFRFYRLIG